MKKLIFGMMVFALGMQARAMGNTYAPTLQNVVVILDLMEYEYSPFLFQSIQGEILEMKMDASCAQIQVSADKTVYCDTASKQVIAVGKLGSPQAPQEGWAAFSVNWYNNVSIIEKIKNGKTIYSLVVTP